MHHSPLVIWPMLDAAMWRWGAAMLRNCTEARYRVNKARMVRLAEYSRDCMVATARRHRHRLRRAHAGHAAAFSHAEATRRRGQGHRDPEAVRRRLRGARQGRLLRRRAGAGRGRAQVRRRAAPARRRDRRLLQVHQHACRDGRVDGSRVPPRDADRGHRRRGRAHRRRAHAPRHAARRRLPRRARQLHAGARRAARPIAAGLSGQGLLDHGADRRPALRARVDDHGRDAQGRRHAPGRPHPRRRHGRARRVLARAARGAAQDARTTSSPICSRAAATSRAPSSGAACAR